jgi:hypothetical protein
MPIAWWANCGLQAPRMSRGGVVLVEFGLHRGLHVDLGEDTEPFGGQGLTGGGDGLGEGEGHGD